MQALHAFFGCGSNAHSQSFILTGSSVSIVMVYGLNGQRNNIQTSTGAHSASYLEGTKGSFAKCKAVVV
jgi:hypothetical protein